MAEENGSAEGEGQQQGAEGANGDQGQQNGAQGAAGAGSGDAGSAGGQSADAGQQGGQQGAQGTQGAQGGDAGQSGDAGQQGTDGAWYDSLPDDVKETAKRYPSAAEVVRQNEKWRAKMSKALVLPGENASDEDLKDFRTKLGVPESPDKYDYSLPEDAPEFVKDAFSPEELADIKKTAHDLGLTQAQLKGLMDYRVNGLAQADEAFARQLEEARANADGQLRREWGKDYEANRNLARRAMDSFGSAEIMDWLTKTVVHGEQLANHPNIIRLMAGAGRRMIEANVHMEHDASAMQTMQEKHAELTRQLHDARAKGDYDAARKFDKERSALSAEMHGTGAVVGRDGRAA